MQMPWPRWPLLLAGLLTAGPSFAGDKLTPLSPTALTPLRAREAVRVQESLNQLRSQRPALGLNAQDDFQLFSSSTDQFGIAHAHFEQLYKGVPVWGSMAITHRDADGRELPVTSSAVRRGIRLDVAPLLRDSDAASLAMLAIQPKAFMGIQQTTRLVVYPQTRYVNINPDKPANKLNAVDFRREVTGYKLAWHVHTEVENKVDGVHHTDMLVDAQSGDTLRKWNSLQTEAAVGTGHSQHSGDVPLNVWHDPDTGNYELRDTTRGTGRGNQTVDAQYADTPNGEVSPDVSYFDTDNDWGDGQNYDPTVHDNTQDANGQTAAVDAHYGLAATWDYYLRIHGRLGIDGIGSPTFNRVHVSLFYDNAFWSDGCFCMSYGDGNGPDFGGFLQMAALDVTGHELTHGVTSHTSGLIYDGESGGLNEANSDIFGTMTEFWTRGGRGATIGDSAGNWLVGEDLNPNGPPLRIMYKPSLDGISADAWYPGLKDVDVHFSSGPLNRAFYFMSQGASPVSAGDDYSSTYLPDGMAGIRNDKAAALWFRATTVYLAADADYVGARTAALQAATDLYGSSSAEYRAAQNAFAAINVGYTAGTFDDLQAPTVSASVSGTAPFLNLNATATDNVAIKRVDFAVDGAIVGSDLSLPYSVTIDTTLFNNGVHELTATAWDPAGNHTTSAPIAFTVSNSFEQHFTDPGFEHGGEGWFADPPENINQDVPTLARTGSGMVWLNGWASTHHDILYQDVTIPAGATQAALTFYLKLLTNETTTTAVRDTIAVQVRNPNTNAVLATLGTFSNLNATFGQYVQRSFNLSAYAGQTIRIHLDGNENASIATSFQVDDFSLRSITGTDTEAPVVTAATAVSGTRQVFTAATSDNGYVTSVEFFVDGTSVGTTTTSFFTSMLLTSLANGAHTLVARATDASGNVSNSAPVPFVVDRTQAQIVVNPSFELSTGWTVSAPVTNSAVIINNASFAHTGSRFFIFWYNYGANVASLRQNITIPNTAASAILSFWLRIYGGSFSDGLPHHFLRAKVRDTAGNDLATLHTYSDADNTNGEYIERRFDLSAFKGQTVQLFFEATIQETPTTPDGTTQFMLDDVTVTTSTLADATAPTVTASVAGASGTLNFTANVRDNVWVSNLEFLVDGNVISSRPNPPATVTVPYDSSSLAPGSHTLLVRATDSSGNVATATANFDVAQPPPADVTAPTVNVSVGGMFETLTLDANANDDTGVTGVEFYVDGALAGRVTTPPYTVPFSPIPLASGEHVVTAVAHDAYGHSTEATATFVHAAIAVAINPTRVAIPVGGSANLTAEVSNANDTSVAWSIQEGPTCGSITAGGAYSAPTAPAVCHASATSNVDPSKSGTATIAVFTADLNGDGTVDGEDMGLLANAHGSTQGDSSYSAAADLDATSNVDDADASLFVSQFGR